MKDFTNVMVHIDNGHAASTPGKRSPYMNSKALPAIEVLEYKTNRQIADRLKKKLLLAGFRVNIITPETVDDVKLTVRANRANKEMERNPGIKHIFISIHSDAFGDGTGWNSVRGWSAYTTKGQTRSDSLAECLYEAADEILPKHGMTVRKDKSDGDSDYEENFTVIYATKMPSVLTENLFYTNEKDAAFIASDEGQEILADVHLEGIKKYVERYL